MAEDREANARERLECGDLAGAATDLLRTFGPELYGFLLAQVRDEAAAAEIFSMFTEDLWRGLPGYAGRASLRVWAYTLAHNAALRYVAAPHRRRGRNVPLSQAPDLAAVADQVRTETLPFLRTEAKSKFAALRERLSAEERALLVLRVDRGLDWLDVARVLFADGAECPAQVAKLQAARLRKRFQQLKTKIRTLAKEAGIIEP